MSDTDTQNGPLDSARGDTQPLSAILERTAVPLLWFSGSLCLLLVMSWTFVLPKFTGVQRPDGTVMSPRAVASYTKQLTAQILEAEKQRTMLVRAVNDPGYRALVDARSIAVSPIDIEQELRQAAARLGEREAGIAFTSISIEGTHVTVAGDVRNAGTRSMTVLAAFIDAVAQLPMITNFGRPAFTRETLPDGSMHSPFRFTFDLPSA